MMNHQLFLHELRMRFINYQRNAVINERNKAATHIDDLYNSQIFLINLDRTPERFEKVLPRIRAAGFKRLERIAGVDARLMQENNTLRDEWAKHGSPKFLTDNGAYVKLLQRHIGREGCILSHLNTWKKIIEMEGVDDKTYFTIFEDDIDFHENWHKLAPKYWSQTPKDFDILFIGNELFVPKHCHYKCDIISRDPTYCTHAYVITRSGAEKLYKLLLNNEGGIYTIDHMLYDLMCNKAFTWYCWRNTTFESGYWRYMQNKKITGLVLQSDEFPSLIIPCV